MASNSEQHHSEVLEMSRMINIKVFDTYRSAIALEAVDGGFIENVEAG